jgi:glycine/D-amino acid oxidase-like deaminating enzyme
VSATELVSRYRQRSLWLDQIPGSLEPRSSLPGDVDCDVAVVGGGFTGLWTAYYLKCEQPDLRVTLIEREIAGFGPSGRNGGWASSGLAGSPAVYRRNGGDDGVRRGLAETQRTVDEIGRVAAEESIDCGYLKSGALFVATTEPQYERLMGSLLDYRANGAGEDEVRVVEPDELETLVHIPRVRGATFSEHCARIDPARLARGLADACERRGVTIYERTAAERLTPGAVHCAAGTVKADVVLRATESYTTQLPGQKLKYLPLYSLMVATEPLSDAVWEELGWRDGLLIGDRHHLFFYAQRTTDGRIAIGGRGAPYDLRDPISERYEQNAEVRARLERTIERHFPAAASAEITHHWGGPLGVPRDWSMSVVYDSTRKVGWAGGYTGHGVVPSNISGRTLCDLVLGRQTDLVTLPWVGHRSRKWEPEPFRFMASRAIVGILGSADRSEDRTDRAAVRTKLVAPFMPPH